MSLPFDATVKDLAKDSPRGFVSTFDEEPAGPVNLLNVDLSTVTTSADLVFGIGDPLQEIVHIDCQASASADKHRDVLAYNALLHRQYAVPVHSIVVLLRPKARYPNLNGRVRYRARPRRSKMDFGHDLVPLWKRPVEMVLAGDLGTTPLAPLCRLPRDLRPEEGLPWVVQQLAERLQREAPPDRARKLLTAAFVLTGLWVSSETALQLFRGVRTMRESTTYMYIVDEGRVDEARKLILRLGKKRFGPAKKAVQVRLAAITDLGRLEHLHDRVLEVSSWNELLDQP
jgi:hypothetical protein